MRRPPHPVTRQRANHAVGFAVWAALVAMVAFWGRWLREDIDIGVGAPPFFGTYERYLTADVAIPIGVGLALIALGPPLVYRIPPKLVPAVAGSMSVGWALALQRADDKTLTAPLTTGYDYLAGVSDVGSPGEYLRTFIDRLPDYPTHVRGHPPGTVLVAWALGELGQPGPEPFLAFVLAAWGLGIAAVLVALWAVAGEAAVKRAAMPIALAPAAVWVATSVDAMFAGVSAIGVALVVVAITRPPGLRADAVALVGGAVSGLALMLTYGAAPLVAIPLGVAAHRQRLRPVVASVAGGAAVLGGVAAAGYWWVDGLYAVRAEHGKGLAGDRPFFYFLVANLAVVAVSCGPAVSAGLSAMHPRMVSPWLLAAGALVGVVIADLSGLSKAEVERIWLLFVPWLLTSVGGTDHRVIPLRLMLVGQVACAIVIQIFLRSAW
jgi:hypothetical protein